MPIRFRLIKFLFTTLFFATVSWFPTNSQAEDETETENTETIDSPTSNERVPLMPPKPDRSKVQGEIVLLQALNKPFNVIYNRELTGWRKGGIIIAHGNNQDMDTPELIRPMRLSFPNHGWDTLSLELLPMPKNDKTITKASTTVNTDETSKSGADANTTETDTPDAQPSATDATEDVTQGSLALGDVAKSTDQNMQRLEAAINHLAAQGNSLIILIGHKSGAYQIAEWAARHANPQVSAVIFIDSEFNGDGELPPMQFKSPILDLTFSDDKKSKRRLADAKRNRLYYFQIKMAPVPSWQEPQVTRVINRIRGWLRKQLTSSGKATYNK